MSDEAREAIGHEAVALAMKFAEMAMRSPASIADFHEVFALGVVEGRRQAREAAAPDFSRGSDYRRENYVREEIVAAIDALETT